jgi:hypothetical protein
MLPLTISYHLEELLKGSAFEGWADYVALTSVVVLFFTIRLFFFASSKINISGKVALITGGGRGIGFMMAKKLALDHGCKVNQSALPQYEQLGLMLIIAGCALGPQPG